MKKTALAFLLFFPMFAWAAADPNPAEYNVNVHVSSSHVDRNGTYNGTQRLSVVIGGKKYELRSELAINRVLAPGDYKAKLVQDEHKTTYDSLQVYEFLFSDKKPENLRSSGRRNDIAPLWSLLVGLASQIVVENRRCRSLRICGPGQ